MPMSEEAKGWTYHGYALAPLTVSSIMETPIGR